MVKISPDKLANCNGTVVLWPLLWGVTTAVATITVSLGGKASSNQSAELLTLPVVATCISRSLNGGMLTVSCTLTVDKSAS